MTSNLDQAPAADAVAGLVLAGGRSVRFEGEKAAADLAGRPVAVDRRSLPVLAASLPLVIGLALAFLLHHVYVLALAGLSPLDTLVAVDIRRYERSLVGLTRWAIGRGAAVVALTDSPLSPLVAGAVRELEAGSYLIVAQAPDRRPISNRRLPRKGGLRHATASGISLCHRRCGRAAEGTRLLNEHTLKRVSRVRIPPSPPNH